MVAWADAVGRLAIKVLPASLMRALGEKDMAFKYLGLAYQQHQGIVFVKVEPELDNIRSDPRYFDLLKRVGLLQ